MKTSRKRPVLALFSPAANVASETFIQAHRDKIDADILFYTNGPFLPTWLNDQPIMRFKYQLQYFIQKRLHGSIGLSLEEFVLKESLKERKPDIVLCEYGTVATHSLRVIRELELPMLVYFHGYDMSVRQVINETNKYASIIEYADKLFVVSRDMKKKIISFGAKPEQVIHNTYGPNDDYFKITRSSQPQKLFVAAGRFTNKKAPHLTLLAFKKVLSKHPSAKLILAGDGDLHQACRDLAEYYDIKKSVELPGIFNSIQMKKWLKQAVAFVQHSVTAENGDQEGTPVVILEALASGLPVVSTKHAGIKDIIADNKTGYLVDEYDVDGMAEKMCSILDNPEKAKAMGKAARKFILKNLTMDNHIGKINQVIYEIYNNKA